MSERVPSSAPSVARSMIIRAVKEPRWKNLASRPVLLAFVMTLAIHLALVFATPAELSREVTEERRRQPQLEVVLDPLPEPEPEEEMQEDFVVPNPDVPAHPPDESINIAERDQEAAQEEAAEEETGTPEVEGEMDEPTQHIVSEDLLEPVPPEEWEMAGDDFGFPGIEGRPIEGFEPAAEEDGTEVPVTEEEIEESDSDEMEVAVELEGLSDHGEQTEEGSEADAEVEPSPRPRPRLSQRAGGPVGTRAGGTTRVGTLAVDANFSEFGDYLTRMMEAITRQWHQLAWEALPSGEVGSVVAVSFQVDRNGEVHNAAIDRSTASLTATLICKDAITSRQPFGSWTRDMQEVLGEEQTVRIRFHYR